MIFICSFLVLFTIFVTGMLLFTAGFVAFSTDKTKTVLAVSNSQIPLKVKQKAYIDLNGRLIELLTKTEEAKAKKDGYKIVYK